MLKSKIPVTIVAINYFNRGNYVKTIIFLSFYLNINFRRRFSLITTNIDATSAAPVVVTTPFEFCEYFNNAYSGLSKTDCSSYSKTKGDPLYTEGTYNITSSMNLVLKDMNIVYTSIRSPFRLSGGKLTIDGGTYITKGSCFLYISYREDNNTTNADGLTINSGDFIAEKVVLRYSQTPICLLGMAPINQTKAIEIFNSILGQRSYYAEFNTTTEIEILTEIAQGVENTSKVYEDVDHISYVDRTKLSVREREPGRGEITPEPESTPEPEPELVPEPESEPEPESLVIIPKAPNTGIGK